MKKEQSPAAKAQGGAAVKAAKEDRGAEEAPPAASPPQPADPTPAAAVEGGKGMKLQKAMQHDTDVTDKLGQFIKEGRLTMEWTYKEVLKEVDMVLDIVRSSASDNINGLPSTPSPRVRAQRPAEPFAGGPVLEAARVQQKPPLQGKLSRLLGGLCGRGGRQNVGRGRKVGSPPGLSPVPPRRVKATPSPPASRVGILATHIARQEAGVIATGSSVVASRTTRTQRLQGKWSPR